MRKSRPLPLLLVPFLFASMQLTAQSSCPLTAYGDTTLCGGGTFPLNATPGFDTYSWSPATGLSDPTIPNPTATVSSTTIYVLTASGMGPNLFTNGDFSLGNTGFTSGQTYSSTYSPCNYYVNNMFFAIPAYTFPDHTSTADNMFMSIDGCYLSPTVIWESTVAVTPFTNYDFSFWASRADAVQPDFEIHFIGDVSGDVIEGTYAGIPYGGVWTWDEYSVPGWNSGANTSLTVRIVNLEINGYGNDFAMDDVSLRTTCNSTDTVVINTNNLSTTVSGTLDLCEGSSTTLTASGGTSFTWNTGDTTAAITVSPSTSTSYTVISDNGTGCIDTVITYVTVAPPPIATLTGADSLCEGENTLLSAGGGINYLWSTGATGANLNVAPAMTTTYSVIVINATNCKDTVSHTINVSPVPLPPVMTSDTTVCIGTVLPVLQATGQNITWYGSAGSTGGSTTAPFPYTDAAGTYPYYATQTVNGCESEKAESSVEVVAYPFINLPADMVLCEGDTVTLVPVSNSSWQYTWMDGSQDLTHSVQTGGTYALTVSNSCGAASDTCLVIYELCECYFYLPNSFTPNGDGINEVFNPVCDCRFVDYHLRIFDRWGEVVFETKDPLAGWDGRYRGILSQQDVYVVQVQYTGKAGPQLITKEYRGHVTVLR